jgi:two-component system OmpR family sensor kinase
VFSSIRTKLALSYALTVLLCLLLAGLAAVVLVQRYQRDIILADRRVIAATLARLTQNSLLSKLSLPDVQSRLTQEARRLDMRALLVASGGLVLADTAEDSALVGRRVQFPIDRLVGSRPVTTIRRAMVPSEGSQYLIISVLTISQSQEPDDSSPRYLILVVPERDLEPAWRQLARPLALAGALSLIAAIIVAVLLSSSIARPLLAMTRASEEIARGNYEHEIPSSGQDEVARLAQSFNHMVREVERSRRVQRDLLANVSHDLKTPLTSIQGFSQAILDGAVHDEDGYRRAAQIIREEAARMGDLVQNLLDLARLEAGGALQRTETIALDELIRRCVERVSPLAVAAGLELRVSVSGALSPVSGDSARLEQAVSNLLDNAIKFTPAGGHVDVAAHAFTVRRGRADPPTAVPRTLPTTERLTDGRWVAVEVKDDGVGISREDLPRIFERFYRVDKSRGGIKGAGLGLSIAKEIVAAHGGAIEVESRPGQGARFVVYLPALRNLPSPQAA